MADAPKKTSNPANDLLWILMVFLGFGILWYLNGGTNAQTANNSGSNSYSSFFSNDNDDSEVKSATTRDIAEGIKDVEDDLEDVQEDILDLKEKNERSAYYGKISLSSGGADEGLSEEYLKIKLSSNLPDNFEVTGLQLYSSVTGKNIIIPGASILPKIGTSNKEAPIRAVPGDTLYIITGTSPIGISFRTNMCTGYFEESYDFEPRLQKSCPVAEDEVDYLRARSALGEACVDAIDNTRTCETPKNLSANLSINCRTFANVNLNYNACVSNHFGDTDFPGHEWYVYLKRTNELWNNDKDTIYLLDQFNQTIDSVSYN